MAVEAVPVVARRKGARPSDLTTQPVPVVPSEIGHARTMIATVKKTVVATAVPVRADESSVEIPFEAEFVDGEPVRPRSRRPITLGDGMLQRVPKQRTWVLHTVVVLVTASIGLVAFAS